MMASGVASDPGVVLQGAPCCHVTLNMMSERHRLTFFCLAIASLLALSAFRSSRFGRTVAAVILPDGRSLNEEQLRREMAWWYQRFSRNDRQPAALEAEARAAKRGLWADSRPVPRWEWRRGAGEAPASPGAVVGNRNSRAYHQPTCPSVRRMAERNRVEFRSAAKAEKAGYRRAGDCR